MRFLKQIRLYIMAAFVFMGMGGALVPMVTYADTPQSVVCTTLDSGSDCSTPSANNGVNINNVIKAIINILSLVVGVVAVIMIIVGGFRFITSGGDSNSIASARNTILYALIGLVVVALAQFIVQFVLAKLK